MFITEVMKDRYLLNIGCQALKRAARPVTDAEGTPTKFFVCVLV